MAKYMVLYRSTATAGEQMGNVSPEEMQAGMALWMEWAQRAGDHLVDMGSPLGEAAVLGGGGGNGGPHVGGFSILQAGSADEVRALLDGHPHFHSPGASIEVLKYLPVPGM